MVGQMHFEQVQVLIDLFDQAQPLHHRMDCSHPAVTTGSGFITGLVVDIASPHHWLKLILPLPWRQAPFTSVLAIAQGFGMASASSKCRFHRLFESLATPLCVT